MQVKVVPAMATPLRHISHIVRRPLAVSSRSTQLIPPRIFAMASARQVSLQADIGKMNLEVDGSFKRAAASFRNWIQKDGDSDFTAERGSCSSMIQCVS